MSHVSVHPYLLLLLAAASCKAPGDKRHAVSILIQCYISFCEKTGPNIACYCVLFFDDLSDCNFSFMPFLFESRDWTLVRLFVDVNMVVLINVLFLINVSSDKIVSSDKPVSSDKRVCFDKRVSSDKRFSSDKHVSSDKLVSSDKCVSSDEHISSAKC